MNLVLFEASEIEQPLPRCDRRAKHILEVLRRAPGETFDAGIINGPRGKATLATVNAESLDLVYSWEIPPAPSEPIILIVGLPRPQTARDILREATSLGVAAIHFVQTEKSDRNYAQSTLWSSGEWRRLLIAGAEQAFATRIPEVTWTRTLAATVAALPASGQRIALDNYESSSRLGDNPAVSEPCILAVGGERGWSAPDRDELRKHQFAFAHLGKRVLRTETAVVSAVTLLRAHLGLM